jgi:hypothetical protein
MSTRTVRTARLRFQRVRDQALEVKRARERSEHEAGFLAYKQRLWSRLSHNQPELPSSGLYDWP